MGSVWSSFSRPARPSAQQVFEMNEPTIVLSNSKMRRVKLEVLGQGAIRWNYKKSKSRKTTTATVVFKESTKLSSSLVLKLEIKNNNVIITGIESHRFNAIPMVDFSSLNLLHFDEPCKYIWISIDKENGFLKLGHGYMLDSNTIVRFEPRSPADSQDVHNLLQRISIINLGDTWKLVTPLKYWRLPIVQDPPPLVVCGESNNMSLLDNHSVTLVSSLPIEARRLYEAVRGYNIALTAEQLRYINYSLRTNGWHLNQTIENKERLSNVRARKRTSYIRVGMGQRLGDSIGDKFVLEIWPISHESAIHAHGDAVGIIKVLHGSIEVSFYNPLVDEHNPEMEPIRTVVLKKGDITFLTPEFYQTHKLRNLRRETASITMQCYSYMGTDTTHREHFDYLSEIDKRMHRFQPKRDFDFDEMMDKVEREFLQAEANAIELAMSIRRSSNRDQKRGYGLSCVSKNDSE